MSTRQERWPLFDQAVLRTITAADWRESLARARGLRNSVRDQIAQKILPMNLGKIQPERTGKHE